MLFLTYSVVPQCQFLADVVVVPCGLKLAETYWFDVDFTGAFLSHFFLCTHWHLGSYCYCDTFFIVTIYVSPFVYFTRSVEFTEPESEPEPEGSWGNEIQSHKTCSKTGRRKETKMGDARSFTTTQNQLNSG